MSARAAFKEERKITVANVRVLPSGFRSFDLSVNDARSLYYALRDALREAGEELE